MTDPDTEQRFSLKKYYEDINKILQGKYVNIGRIGLPNPGLDAEGLSFLLMIPVLLVLLVCMDPFCGWNRWRFMGLALGGLTALVMFVLLVFVGVQYELGGTFGLAEDSPSFIVIENIGTGGLAGVIFFLWPRTILLVVALVAVISAIGFIL